MRAISAICSVAQQAALDSHRVSQSVSSKLNLVENFIKGGKQSIVVLTQGMLRSYQWKYETEDIIYALLDNSAAMPYATRVVAAYNPAVLTAVKLVNGDVKTVCKNGITVVCNYYGVELSTLELYSLTELMCYRCEAYSVPSKAKEEDKYVKPITTKEGLASRDMRWMTVAFANHYGKVKELQTKGRTRKMVRPDTITDAAAFCNFTYM